MTTDQLLQLTRELVASPHFSYQPQMRLRNGAIVLEVWEQKRLLTFDQGDVCVISTNHSGSGILPDLEDDATVGVLRGMMCTAWGAGAHVEFYPNQGRARVDVICAGRHHAFQHDVPGCCVAVALLAAP